MKKFLLFFSLVASLFSSSQLPEGIDPDHLLAAPTLLNATVGFEVKKIMLATGVELEYIEQGDRDGIPVVFLHGLSDSWHSFEAAFKFLPPSIHAFALSQRGHGHSGKPKQGYAPTDFAADVASFIQLKNLKKAVVVGHSMGGIHTMQFVINHPGLARAIVIVGSDPAISKNQGMPEFLAEVMKLQGDVISYPFMFEFQRSTLAKPIDSTWFNVLVDEGLKCPVPVFKSAISELMAVDLTAGLKKSTVPVLVIWGDKDQVFLKQGQDRMKQSLKNVKSITYNGTGHALHWEEPQRFANDLVNFIETLRK